MASLQRLISPAHIAVFGGAWAGNVIRQLQKAGYEGEIWPVHPSKTEVAGLRAYASVDALPEAPDASFIGVNRKLTPEILGALSKRGAGGAVCFASGFAETESDASHIAEAGELSGSALQQLALEKAGDMPFLGPNCYGFVNYLDKVPLWPDEHGGTAVTSGVAIITQSSNMAITLSMSKRALPLAFLGTAGNQAQIDMCDLAMGLLDDPRITALGLHIEGISSLAKLEQLAAKARAQQVPIIALKVGKSDAAQQATLSHTASLAGSDVSADALFERLGIARLHSLGAFVEALKLAHDHGAFDSPAIASLSCSGGEASLMADAASQTCLTFPDLTTTQTTRLAAALGPLVHLSNPLDYQTYIWGDEPVMTEAFAAMLEGPQAVSILILDPPRADRCDEDAWYPARDCLIAAVEQTQRKAILLSTLPETLTEGFVAPLHAHHITPVMGLEDGLAAIEALVKIGAAWAAPAPLSLPASWASSAPAGSLTEDEGKDRLASLGIDVPKNRTAATADAALEAAKDLTFPLVVKGLGFAHKTEAGAVRLNITSEAMLTETLASLAAPDGYLIEEMIIDPVLELLLGVTIDPAHGPLLTIAQGGIYTELLDDKVHLSLPAHPDAIAEALTRLRCWPIMTGYRGKAGGAVIPLQETITRLCDHVLASAASDSPLVEIEMNPVIITTDRAVAVDALLVTGQPPSPSKGA